jgi:hypothetical protein
VSEAWQSKPIHAVENPATSEKLLRSDPTKLPKNNNTAAAAKTAAGDFFSLLGKELGKQKGLPRGKTRRELDERRRFLLRQGEELVVKYAQAH